MLKAIETVNDFINNIVWGWPCMILLLGVGLYLTVGSRFLQVRKFGYSMKNTIGRVLERKSASSGTITPFQALCTALAATVGTGNIAGVAGAIALGGPGAVFWMWISALLGMCTKYAEIVLAVHFRKRNEAGEWVGGPMHYIKNGMGKGWGWLAALFAAFAALASFGIGNATQVGSIKDSVNSMLYGFGLVPSAAGLPVANAIIGVAMAIILLLILLGGMKRLASVTERLVPFMAILYIILGLGVVIMNIEKVPGVFASIFEGAFTPAGVTGGVVGSIFISMKRGISRGIFSNEAGLGSAPMAHASSDTDSPVKQGLYGIFEVFADTIVICTLTALIVLCAGQNLTYGVSCGAEMTISGFTATYGSWVSVFAAVAIVCFAFSTILGWGLYGSRAIEYLLGRKSVKVYTVIYCLVAVLGATVDLGLLWDIADTLNGLMAIPNLIAVAILSPVVFRLTKEYFDSKSASLR
ncbi:MAG: sodium:alanine symporter family protein [Clostridia bacterium]|nr:sodium:alanine symporter family protein [Clostridia bacterium]